MSKKTVTLVIQGDVISCNFSIRPAYTANVIMTHNHVKKASFLVDPSVLYTFLVEIIGADKTPYVLKISGATSTDNDNDKSYKLSGSSDFLSGSFVG